MKYFNMFYFKPFLARFHPLFFFFPRLICIERKYFSALAQETEASSSNDPVCSCHQAESDIVLLRGFCLKVLQNQDSSAFPANWFLRAIKEIVVLELIRSTAHHLHLTRAEPFSSPGSTLVVQEGLWGRKVFAQSVHGLSDSLLTCRTLLWPPWHSVPQFPIRRGPASVLFTALIRTGIHWVHYS